MPHPGKFRQLVFQFAVFLAKDILAVFENGLPPFHEAGQDTLLLGHQIDKANFFSWSRKSCSF